MTPSPIRWARRAAAALTMCALAVPVAAQEPDALALRRLVTSLTVTPRVLIIGAHPDDDDPQLMTWLARGRGVQTAYLSLTRGEAGQNFAGAETGGALGAVRTRELLAARRIDGGEQFFTRAVDFGMSKNAEETFKHWPQRLILADLVVVIRAFRPHVIVCVFPETLKDGNGQHEALGILARDAFRAAGDTTRVPASALFGRPWQALKFYRHGAGITMDLSEFDRVSGRTLADIAVDSRAQHRTQGLTGTTLRRIPRVTLKRVDAALDDTTALVNETSIFAGIDTSVARLTAPEGSAVAQAMVLFTANADSARTLFDLNKPSAIVPYLIRAAHAAKTMRRASTWCHHAARDASIPVMRPPGVCDQPALDLDASVDLMQQRTTDALLLAAGVSFEVAADRELLATADTIPVTVTMYNRGSMPVTLADVAAAGSTTTSATLVVVPPDSVARDYRMVSGLINGHPWWLAGRERDADMYSRKQSSIDGIERGDVLVEAFSINGIAVPEGIRRESDVTVTVAFEGATVTKSLGPALFRYADAAVGLQQRPVSGVPAVSLAFERTLEWILADKPVARQIRLAVKSFSDRPQSFKLNLVAPKGIRLDSVPESITLEPREQRELFIRARSVVDTGRHVFGIVGMAPGGGELNSGFRTLQYPYLTPIHFFRASAVYLRAVNVTVPPDLTVVYVAATGDDTPNSLKGVGMSVAVVSAEDLLSVDLAKISTVVIGPRVYDAYPQLADQTTRLLEFVRKGGTIVTLQHASIPSRVLPFPIVVGRPTPTHITHPDAAIRLIEPKSRLMAWPNTITAAEWQGWARERALFVPTAVDPKWTSVVEAQDPDALPNRNTLLTARIGKGTYIYTTLSLTDQIEVGVPGAMRLMVNLLSAGMSAEKPATAKR